MRIAVLSDTHVRTLNEVPAAVRQALGGVDLILHAGDFTELAVLDELKTVAEVRAVCGNMDSRELKGILPRKDVFELQGKRIGLTHGWGPPWEMELWVRRMFADVDLVVFGHSHKVCHRYVQGSLMFNPGRVSESFGLLTIDGEMRAETIRV